MYLLNQAVDYILDGEYILFTFHYVSIKSYGIDLVDCEYMHIYIPLCIY